MPTMREVAVALKIDLNTVRHTYDELERMGAITLVRGRGSFVAQPPPAISVRAQAMQIDSLANRLSLRLPQRASIPLPWPIG
jgi:GntR family transcriptional regulator